jgi:hypothetical protein
VMYSGQKSDSSIVAKKSANKSGQPEAESMEPREGTKENTGESPASRTQSREIVPGGLDRVRQAARGNQKERFTALLHHVTPELLWQAYHWLKRSAAPGVDGVRWHDYEENLEAKLVELHARVHRGSYHPLPSRRKYIAKADGRSVRWASPPWRTRSFSVRWWRYQCGLRAGLLGFSYGFGLGGRMTRSMHWRLGSHTGP